MQAVAAAVQAQCTLALARCNVGNVYVKSDVRVSHRYVGTVAGALLELVYNGILHLVADELGVPELF